MWLYYLFPILIDLLFLPLYFFDTNGIAALIEMFICTIVTPIYLVIVSYNSLNNVSISSFFKNLIVMLVIVLSGILITYFNWGISTSKLLMPDSETVLLTQIQIIVSLVLVIVGWTIACFIKRKR